MRTVPQYCGIDGQSPCSTASTSMLTGVPMLAPRDTKTGLLTAWVAGSKWVPNIPSCPTKAAQPLRCFRLTCVMCGEGGPWLWFQVTWSIISHSTLAAILPARNWIKNTIYILDPPISPSQPWQSIHIHHILHCYGIMVQIKMPIPMPRRCCKPYRKLRCRRPMANSLGWSLGGDESSVTFIGSHQKFKG